MKTPMPRTLVPFIIAVLLIAPGVSPGSAENPDEIDAAGCLIVTPDGFVMAINRLLGRLQLPAGRHVEGESARETAARETHEETGLDVTVGDPALRLDDNRVVFFHCAPRDPDADLTALAPIDRVEVSRTLIVNPVTMRTPEGELIETPWRFPHMHWLLRTVFRSVAQRTGSMPD